MHGRVAHEGGEVCVCVCVYAYACLPVLVMCICVSVHVYVHMVGCDSVLKASAIRMVT